MAAASSVGILMLVPSGWDEIWTGRHQIAARLARRHPLVWVTPPPTWQQACRQRPHGAIVSPAGGAPDVAVHTSATWWPHVYRPAWLRDALFARRLARARRVLVDRGARQVVLYVWRPQFSGALDLVPHDLSVYHVNDEYSFSATNDAPSARELDLLRRADLVCIHSPELMRRKGHFNRHTMMLPNGVDFQAFAVPRPIPADLASIPGPRVGYVGWLKRHLDWAMLETLVKAQRSCSFVFIGPTSPHPELAPVIARLSGLPHVHFLGGRPAALLPDYVQHLDVCLLPYVDNAYTRCIYPLKLHESLAAGKPVIATSLPSITPFAEVVTVVEPGEAWSGALEGALAAASSDSEQVAARQAVARAHDWDLLVDRLEATLSERLAAAD